MQPGSPAHSHGGEPTRGDTTPDCPLGTAFQIGCAPSASLPSTYAPEFTVARIGQISPYFEIVIPAALSISQVFHPPRI